MLNFTYTYCNAYDKITVNCDMSMRDYELSNEEWKIVKDLADVLKVSGCMYTLTDQLEVYRIAMSKYAKPFH